MIIALGKHDRIHIQRKWKDTFSGSISRIRRPQRNSSGLGIARFNPKKIGFPEETFDAVVSWCCTTLNDGFSRKMYFVVTGQDITELRQRTEELEGFTYSVSHDMRAPLRAVDGFTRILMEEYSQSLDDEGRRLPDIVRHNTEKWES